MCIVFGGVGLIYARQKLAPPNGAANEDNTHDTVVSSPAEMATPTTLSIDTSESTPDWLKEENSPFGNEDVFSGDTPQSTDIVPDWLQDAPKVVPVDPVPEESEVVENIQEIPDASESQTEPTVVSETPISSESGDIPDWLQGAPSIPDLNKDATPKLKAL